MKSPRVFRSEKRSIRSWAFRRGQGPKRHRRLLIEPLENRRLLAAGMLDESFGGDGTVVTAIEVANCFSQVAHAVAVQPDGKIVVAGDSYNGSSYDFALVRYNADGSLDNTFDTDGKVATDIGMSSDSGYGVAIQPDGKIVVAGSSAGDFALVRYNADGSLDNTFDSDGKVVTDIASSSDSGYSVALQPDGKIVVAGSSSGDFSLVRYNADGSLDTSFDTDGKVTTDFGASYAVAYTVALQPDGKIVAAGSSSADFVVMRYNADGSLDTGFDTDGKATADFAGASDTAYSVAVQPDGKIVVGGSSYAGGSGVFAAVRYKVDGSLDTGFDGDGKVTTDVTASADYGRSLAVQPDGKIVFGGNSSSGGVSAFAVVRYQGDGSLDAGFGADGKVATEFGSAFAVALQPDGRILVAGYSSSGGNADFALARYESHGELDLSFGAGGKVTTGFDASADAGRGVAVQADGKIVVAGSAMQGGNQDFALVQYHSDGSLNAGFGTGGKVTTSFGTMDDIAESVAVQPDGKIVVAGYSQSGSDYDLVLTRYNAEGSLDAGFGTGGKVTTDVWGMDDFGGSMTLQPDGKIVVAGTSRDSLISGMIFLSLVRYHADGSLDSDFGTAGKVVTYVGDTFSAESVAVQSDGKIVVAGSVAVAGSFDFVVVRYNADGAPDTSFNGDGVLTTDFGGAADQAYSVAVQSDGRIVVAGHSRIGSSADFALARYNADGGLDTSFGTGGRVTTDFAGADDQASSVAVQSNGRIVVAGHSRTGGNTDFALARYESDGSLDAGFGMDGKVTTDFGQSTDLASGVTVQPDGKIVAAGQTMSPTGQAFAVARYEGDPVVLNTAPTGLILIPAEIAENQPAGTVVGTFTTTDLDLPDDSHTYQLVSGPDDGDNSSFAIVGDQLVTTESFDFEVKSDYSVRVRTIDASGLWFEQAFTISVSDIDEIPPTVAGTTPSLDGGTLAVGTVSLGVEFSEPVVGGELAANYELRSLGPDALLGTPDDALVPLTVSYSDRTAALEFAEMPASVYRLTVRGSVTDAAGNALDGDEDGAAGGDWVADFVVLPGADEALFAGTPVFSLGGMDPRSVATDDFNHDGIADLAVANYALWSGPSANVGILLGTERGGFVPVVNYGVGYRDAVGVVSGRFNDDGHVDLAVADDVFGWVVILLGRGDGTFAGPTEATGVQHATSLATGDFDGNGYDDLALSGTGQVAILMAVGDGTFQPPVFYEPGGDDLERVAVADLDRDGDQDLAVAIRGHDKVGILLGNGDGTFANGVAYPSSGDGPQALAIQDFDGDGELDIAVANKLDGKVTVLPGMGSGAFGTATVAAGGLASPISLAASDFDGDGLFDLAVANYDSDNVAILRGTVGGGFAAAAILSTGGEDPRALAVGDWDRDGRDDLAVANSRSGTVGVLYGTGGGTFTDAVAYSAGRSHANAVEVADFDGDGRQDIASAVSAGASWNLAVALGRGDGTYTPPRIFSTGSTFPIISLKAHDFNADGYPDLAASGSVSGGVAIFMGQGDGTFAEPVAYDCGIYQAGSPRLTLGDFDLDGDQDLAVAAFKNLHAGLPLDAEVGILSSNGDGTFTAAGTYSAGFTFTGNYLSAVATGEFNGDGYDDLIVLDPTNHGLAILLNDGQGGFPSATLMPVPSQQLLSVAVGDLDGDGKQDLALGGSARVLLGQGDGTFVLGAEAPTGGTGVYALSMADIDADGHLDLVAANSHQGTVGISLGNGDATFGPVMTYSTGGAYPWALAVADLDGDEVLDVAVAHEQSGDVGVLLGTGGGRFAAVPAYGKYGWAGGDGFDGWTGMAAEDLNGDNIPDVAAAYSGTVQISLGDGNGGLIELVSYGTGGIGDATVAIADFDNDGHMDLATGNFHTGAGPIAVRLGNGDGTFRLSSAHYSTSGDPASAIVAADMDGDGHQDLVTAHALNDRIAIWRNRGDGTFEASVTYSSGGDYPSALAVDDFDQDGRKDVAVVNRGSNSVAILFREEDGTFATLVLSSGGDQPRALVVGDFNGDGRPDMAVVNYYASNNVLVLLGAANRTFQPGVSYSTGSYNPMALTVDDFNGDGRQDLAVANFYYGRAGSVGLLFGQGDGTFAVATTIPSGGSNPRVLVSGDFNQDGDADLVVAHSGGRSITVLANLTSSSAVVLSSVHGLPFDVQTGGLMAGQLVQGPGNAFDGLNRLQVGGSDFAPPVRSPQFADDGQTLLVPADVLAGLTVRREITVPDTGGEDFARTVDVFYNPTADPVTTTVRIVGNLGSDAATTVFATSDGDTDLETADQWIGTDDTTDGGGAPAILQYIHGPVGLQPTSVVRTGDNLEWTYSLTVPASQTVRLAHFTIVAASRAAAVAAGQALVLPDRFGGQAAAFLELMEQGSIANFAYNLAPLDIRLTGTSLPENQAAGTVVGSLSTVDPNPADTFTYRLVAGDGSTDNGWFVIEGNELKTRVAFDYETKNSYSIRIRSTDPGGLWFEKSWTITVLDLDDAATTWRLDFNGFHGYTEPNYIGVPPWQLKTSSNPFGWRSLPPQYFERNWPEAPPYTSETARLRYDGQATDNMGTPLTFEVEVQAGRTYEVLIFTGDTLWNRDQERFTVAGSGGSSITTEVDTWGAGAPEGSGVNGNWGGGATNPAAGCYRWVRQTVTVGGSLDEVGTISVTMADLGGLDAATVILALDIRPAELVPPITLTRTSPADSELPLTELPADGLTRDTYQGTGAPANAVVTVTVSAGSPPQYATVLPDIDATMFGAQVLADAFGQFAFTVLRPATLTNTTLDPPQTSEAWTITAEEVSGLARATVTQAYVAPSAAAPLRFDFGVSGSPVQESPDFLPIVPQTVYSQTRGYGWLSRVAGVNRKDPAVSALQTDLNYAPTAVFKVDLPDGVYSVRIHHSNPKYDGTVPYVADNFQVFAEDAAQYTVENIPAGTTAIRTFTVNVSGGALELRFLDLGGLDENFVVSGIEVSYVGPCWHNPIAPYDVSGDQRVTPLDALIVINYVNSHSGDLPLPPPPSSQPAYYDVDRDGICTPRDVLIVINYTNRLLTGTAEGESRLSSLREPIVSPTRRGEGGLGSPPTPGHGGLARWPWDMPENHADGPAVATQGGNGTQRVARGMPEPRWTPADGLAVQVSLQSFNPTSAECEAILEDFADDVAGRWRMESSTPQVHRSRSWPWPRS